MIQKPFFDRALAVVSEKRGVSTNKILSSSSTTDASWCRHVLAKQLADRGYNNAQIAKMIGVSPSSIGNYLGGYDRMFKLNHAFQEFALQVHFELMK